MKRLGKTTLFLKELKSALRVFLLGLIVRPATRHSLMGSLVTLKPI